MFLDLCLNGILNKVFDESYFVVKSAVGGLLKVEEKIEKGLFIKDVRVAQCGEFLKTTCGNAKKVA